MTVKTFKYLGPKQKQVLMDLDAGYELGGSWSRPYRLTMIHSGAIESSYALPKSLVRGLEERGLIREQDTVNPYVSEWVLTVRGKLEVEKLKKGKR